MRKSTVLPIIPPGRKKNKPDLAGKDGGDRRERTPSDLVDLPAATPRHSKMKLMRSGTSWIDFSKTLMNAATADSPDQKKAKITRRASITALEFSSAEAQKSMHSKRKWMLYAISQPIALTILFSLGWLMDLISTSEASPSTLSRFFHNALYVERSRAEYIVSVVVRLTTTIIAIVFQISAIMMQIAASQFTQDVFGVLMRDPKLIGPVFMWLSTLTYSVFLSFGIGDGFTGSGHIFVLLFLSLTSILLLPVYFGFLVTALNPNKIINKILSESLQQAGRFYYYNRWSKKMELPSITVSEVNARKLETIRLIEATSGLCFKAMQRNDSGVAYHAIEALRMLAVLYGKTKANWEPSWFSMPDHENPDNFR